MLIVLAPMLPIPYAAFREDELLNYSCQNNLYLTHKVFSEVPALCFMLWKDRVIGESEPAQSSYHALMEKGAAHALKFRRTRAFMRSTRWRCVCSNPQLFSTEIDLVKAWA